MTTIFCQSQTFFPSEKTTRKKESEAERVGLAAGTDVCEGVVVNIVVGDGVNEGDCITIADSVSDSGDGTDCVGISERDD